MLYVSEATAVWEEFSPQEFQAGKGVRQNKAVARRSWRVGTALPPPGLPAASSTHRTPLGDCTSPPA